MNETEIGTAAFGAIIGLAIGCFLYMLGGRKGKWKRRFVGSLVIALTTNFTAALLDVFQLWHLLVYPVLAIAFTQGYGGDTTAKKVIRRTIFAVGVVAAGLVYAVTLGGNAWLVFPLHAGVAAWSIWLGIKNPIHAAAEETFVCLLLNTGLIMYAFTKVMNP